MCKVSGRAGRRSGRTRYEEHLKTEQEKRKSGLTPIYPSPEYDALPFKEAVEREGDPVCATSCI